MQDTIAAISTALAPSGIAIVRISGEDALDIADRIYQSKSKKKLKEQASHTIHYGHILFEGRELDEVLVTVLRAPHSYTGENTVEINCHGGMLAVQSVLSAVCSSGARPAQPGEFTKRAFLNGRIDLSQAEAVMDVISAKNEYALRNSMSRLDGKLGAKIKEIRGALLYEFAWIESALDDPEHYSLEGYPERLAGVISEEKKNIDALLSSFLCGKWIDEGIRTVILGKPNVGKSSLLNILAGCERAIVTDIPGTTRDVLEETIRMDGFSLRVLDTAGLRKSSDPIEKIGVEKAEKNAREADLILYIADRTRGLDSEDRKILQSFEDKKIIFLLNKSDLAEKTSAEEAKKLCDCPVLEISAKTGAGINTLKKTISAMFFNGELSFDDEVYITNERHRNLLRAAKESLCRVEDSILAGMPEDFFSIDISEAIGSLDGITGENVSEDLVDEIFSRFCTGK